MPDIDLSIDRPKMKSYFFGEAEDRIQNSEEDRTPPEPQTANAEKVEDRSPRTSNPEKGEVRQLWPLRPGGRFPPSQPFPAFFISFDCCVRSTLSFVLNRHGLFTLSASKIVQL
jgi:hypothetical protein